MHGNTDSLMIIFVLLIPAFIGGVVGALLAWWLDLSFVWMIIGAMVAAYFIVAALILADIHLGGQ